MKNLKKLSTIFLTLIIVMVLDSCSGCDNENPSARVVNRGTDDVSVQIKTSGGSTENINNIPSGSSSNYVSYAPGEIEYTIVLKDKTELVETVTMSFCRSYQITVDENNNITTTSKKVD